MVQRLDPTYSSVEIKNDKIRQTIYNKNFNYGQNRQIAAFLESKFDF